MAKSNKDFFKTKKEWSEIKDSLLGCYLPPYFQKILMTKRPVLYVDCFAGKGKFEDGKDGSPLIALKARNDCLGRSTISSKYNAIEMCLIDLNYANDLRSNTASYANQYGAPQIIGGKYEDSIISVLKNKRNYNVFLYIDPYGIKALDSALFDQFESFGFFTFEMLINFNSFGFFRDACQVLKVDCSNDEAFQDLSELVEYEPTTVDSSKDSETLLTAIAGGEYWKEIVRDYQQNRITGYQAEQRLSTEYKQRLKQRYTYVLDLPVRLKPGQRPKYRMIHVCSHEDGCFLMAENMQRRKEELFIGIQQSGQISLFDMPESDVSSSAEGDFLTKEQIAEKVMEHLRNNPQDVRITKFLATFVNEYGLLCEFSTIYDILQEKEQAGLIKVMRSPAQTKIGKPSTFWSEKESDGKTITIRRLRT